VLFDFSSFECLLDEDDEFEEVEDDDDDDDDDEEKEDETDGLLSCLLRFMSLLSLLLNVVLF
jgi:hypothetical protein